VTRDDVRGGGQEPPDTPRQEAFRDNPEPPPAGAVDPLLAWRGEFPILEHTVYMINHSLGAMPRAVYAEMRAYADAWAVRGIRAWEEGWWGMPVETGNLIAGLIGAEPGSVVMHPNVTTAAEVVLSCYDWREPRNTIVTTDVDFPSVLYLLERTTRRGARLVRVPSRDGLSFEMEELLRAIDEATRLVVISQVLFKSAAIVDAAAVVRRAREVGEDRQGR